MPAELSYAKFTAKAQLDKAVNSLLGILEGVSFDGVINPDEVALLSAWLREYRQYEHRHPFTELFPVISAALIDNELTQDEHENLTWLCQKLRSTIFYDETTADLQRLQGLLVGIAGDGIISEIELIQLSDWLAEHESLRTRYPFDELESLLTTVLQDHKIDPDEHTLLLAFLQDFSGLPNLITGEIAAPTLRGICALAPVIEFPQRRFCFTGESARYPRETLTDLVIQRGGQVVSAVSKKLDYLVVGAAGNPCWKYACYGRKIETVMQLRRAGASTLILHEADFLDCLE